MSGLFVTFEGGEGAGKSTQISLLLAHLRARGFDALQTREPGGTPGAEFLRNLILSGAAEAYGAKMEAMLFAAARADHVDKLIRPALQQGHLVLCDRFIDSTRAYQGSAGDLDGQFLTALEQVTIGGVMPDLTIILDIAAADGLARANARRGIGAADRFEKETLATHEQRRQAFLAIAQREPERCRVVDANRAQAEIAGEIAALVDAKLQERGLV